MIHQYYQFVVISIFIICTIVMQQSIAWLRYFENKKYYAVANFFTFLSYFVNIIIIYELVKTFN